MFDIYVPKGVKRSNVTTICKIADFGYGEGVVFKAGQIKGVTAERLDALVQAGYAAKNRFADGIYYQLTAAAIPIAQANN